MVPARWRTACRSRAGQLEELGGSCDGSVRWLAAFLQRLRRTSEWGLHVRWPPGQQDLDSRKPDELSPVNPCTLGQVKRCALQVLM